MKHRNESAITLVALVITIIVLLILAGITISLTVGQDGILKQAQQAGIKNEEAEAREKLELTLLDLQADKRINANYNENEYIDTYLLNKQMVVMGDIVLVNGWQFQIDRSVPKIAMSLGKGQESKQIVLVANVEDADDYTKATINVEISYDGEIKSVQINGQEEQIPEKIDGKYVLQKEILTNGSYTIFVKDTNDNYKIATVQVREISEDTKLESVEDFIAFRDKVNNGATFEGKTITLTNDLDLSSVCGEQIGSWEPIGNESKPFKGTFNGNGYKIEKIYINTTEDNQGLFGYIDNGNIKNINVQGNIVANNATGLICGRMLNNSRISYCISQGTVTSTGVHIGGILGRGDSGFTEYCINYVNVKGKDATGGIAGIETSETSNIQYSANYGNISSNQQAGGICGCANINSSIKYCYNMGDVSTSVNYGAGGIVGTFGHPSEGVTGTLEGCYNMGNIKGLVSRVGGICGFVGNIETVRNILNCGDVYLSSTKATIDIGTSSNYLGRIIGQNYNEQILNYKNITKGELQNYTEEMLESALGKEYTIDVQNKDGTWKYNNGYPILKWQVQE